MPEETATAIIWALTQQDPDGNQVTVDAAHDLVHFVREWFNDNSVTYESFGYDDLVPFLA